jgi:methionyl-tRNA formyltransferase
MTTKRIVIVGNGRMAQSCIEILLAQPAASVRLLVAEDRTDAAQDRLAAFCRRRDVPLLRTTAPVNDPGIIAQIAAARPHLIFSIDNFQIFGAELLAIPEQGSVNFHNGPIGRYRGVHIPSWAIFNGETEHGITWHYMDRRVDSGASVAALTFPLTGTETALALTLECIRVGVAAFAESAPRILAGDRGQPVPISAARCYRQRDLPNGGKLDFGWPAARIDRLLRALDFRPLPNSFTYARLELARGTLIVNEARNVGDSRPHTPGTIVAAGDRLVVACADRLLELVAVMLQPDEETSVATAVDALGLEAGQPLHTG